MNRISGDDGEDKLFKDYLKTNFSLWALITDDKDGWIKSSSLALAKDKRYWTIFVVGEVQKGRRVKKWCEEIRWLQSKDFKIKWIYILFLGIFFKDSNS